MRHGFLKVVTIKGGLGNQMFQYAFYMAHKKHHPFSLYLFFLEDDALYAHAGFQLDELFNIRILSKDKFYRFINKYLSRILKYSTRIVEKNSFQYNENYFKTSNMVSIYDGYWQSEKYFSSIADTVRETFKFPKSLLNVQTVQLESYIKKKESVSVHIRRGDYLAQMEKFGLCDLSYYNNAIEYMRIHLTNPIFIFFSDDIAWVKENLPIDDAIYVSWNQNKDSWQDVYLMSRCTHNIIANSTFSWWGAWLNANSNKIVISPKRWFAFSPNYDLLPQEWVTI